MDKFVCQYCYVTSDSALSAAHHVCGLSMLKDRIDGLEAHCKMWHREAMRLADKYNEDTFYHSRQTAPAIDESIQEAAK